jgi:carboxypeptidase Q
MYKILFVLITFSQLSLAQNADSLFIRKIFDEALSNGRCYPDLRSLCKDIGARLAGSAQADMAVYWGEQRLRAYGFDSVYLQPIMVPHWERGNREVAWIKFEDGSLRKIPVTALGGSIGTNGIIEAEIAYFNTLDDLKKAPRSAVEGKIVFINQPMNEKEIVTFRAYGGCYAIRNSGAVEGARLGAVAVVIRSINLSHDDHPHTGGMTYEDGVKQIPSAAISTNDAEFIKANYKKQKLSILLDMNCQMLEPKPSHNVIGEIRGSKFPNRIITVGGHLDSWDIGEGAHDDGAGIVHSIEALRLLKVLGYRPNFTLRVVLFMNEENGNMGGMTYASWVKERGEEHIVAIESDRGGFSPRGFDVDGNSQHLSFLRSFAHLFKPYELHHFEKGFGGVDIMPLKQQFPGIALFGFVPDSQRYFDFHHAETDVFEAVNKRELELGAASIASLIYLIDKYYEEAPQLKPTKSGKRK